MSTGLVQASLRNEKLSKVTSVPVTFGRKGLCYDVEQVEDEKMRKRLIKNRESAERSRKRKLETERSFSQMLAERDVENEQLRRENAALRVRLEEVENALAGVRAFGLCSSGNFTLQQ